MSKLMQQITVKDNKTQREIIYTNNNEKGLWYQVDSNNKTISITQLSEGQNMIIAYLFDYSIIDVKWK